MSDADKNASAMPKSDHGGRQCDGQKHQHHHRHSRSGFEEEHYRSAPACICECSYAAQPPPPFVWPMPSFNPTPIPMDYSFQYASSPLPQPPIPLHPIEPRVAATDIPPIKVAPFHTQLPLQPVISPLKSIRSTQKSNVQPIAGLPFPAATLFQGRG